MAQSFFGELRELAGHKAQAPLGLAALGAALFAGFYAVAAVTDTSPMHRGIYFAGLFGVACVLSLTGLSQLSISAKLDSVESKLARGELKPEDSRRFVKADVIEDVLCMLVIFLFATASFVASVHYFRAADARIFTAHDGSWLASGLFGLDIILRSALFDVMEHFKLRAGRTEMGFAASWFVVYVFVFRSYVSLVALASLFKGIAVFSEFRRNRHLLKQFAGKD